MCVSSAKGDVASVLSSGIDSFALWVKVGEEMFQLNETLKAETWNMVCVGLSADPATPTPSPTSTPEEDEVALQTYQVKVHLY